MEVFARITNKRTAGITNSCHSRRSCFVICAEVVSDEYKGVEKWMIWTLERIRVTIFLFLFFVPLFLYAMAKYQQIPFVSPTLIEFVLFFVNAGIFLVFVVFAWKPQETKGADTNVSLLEKVLAKSHQQRGVK